MSERKEETHNPTEAASASPVNDDLPPDHLSHAESRLRAGPTTRRQSESDGSLPADITDNEETNRAVDAITNDEADEVLAVEDAARDGAEGAMPKHRMNAFFSAWLGTRRGWTWTTGVLLVVAAAVVFFPTTRYFILNTAGVRCSLSLTALDGDTQLALPGATVADNTISLETNHAGMVTLRNLKLGRQTLKLTRPGFAPITESVVLGWGENPLGSMTMRDVGQQYTVFVHDYVTGAVIGGATASNNGLEALGDTSGKITLTVSGNANEQPVPITISASGYVTKSVTLSGTSNKPVSVTLVPSQKEVYVAYEGGLYNLYSCYADGTGQQVLLPGTSSETSNIALTVSPDSSEAALVSTRDTNATSNGAVLQAMTLVNVSNGTVLTLDHALQMKVIGWVGTTLIYEEETAGGSSPSYSLISYNYSTSSRNNLATSSQFTGVTLAAGTIYYAVPGSASTTADGFYAIQPDGSGKQTILQQDVWSMLRSTYNTFNLQTANGWYSYDIGSSVSSALANTPNNLTSIQYLDSPNGKQSASVVDGQLHVYTISSNKDQTLSAVVNAAYPLRWLTNTDLIYRVSDGSTSDDYIIDVNSGAPKLITSLTNTTGTADS